MKPLRHAALAALLFASGAVVALGNEDHPKTAGPVAKKEQKPWGIAGDVKAARRRIESR